MRSPSPTGLRAVRSPVELATSATARHAGRVAEVVQDAVILTSVVTTAAHPGAEHLIRLDAVVALRGLGRAVARRTSPVPSRT